MGSQESKRSAPALPTKIAFDHFVVLRAIGKGGFGKVCIVRKRDTKMLYAMKYMSKANIVAKRAVKDVLRELHILARLDHPFIVRLWFSFQDEEDLFLVMELLLGGDLRYHLGRLGPFADKSVRLFAAEIVLALEYLRERSVIHRDIKPSNILLDADGHCYLTDFSVAYVCDAKHVPTSLAGTKPYIAPEMFASSQRAISGYGCAVDWWSLGVTVYELLKGKRPFSFSLRASDRDMLSAVKMPVNLSSFESETRDLLSKLLSVEPGAREEHILNIRSHSYFSTINWDRVLAKQIKPSFVPGKDTVNADPCLELEELLLETRPLHKKKSRLKKVILMFSWLEMAERLC
eukprot:m.72405 g.72405  ORF g.72405 m.72405 type:complete len:347 (+) comp35799_c0_seq7:675-1715(+)